MHLLPGKYLLPRMDHPLAHSVVLMLMGLQAHCRITQEEYLLPCFITPQLSMSVDSEGGA